MAAPDYTDLFGQDIDEVFGILEFENLHIGTDEENTTYYNLQRD